MEEALDVSRSARSLFPQDLELRFREGVLLHDLGRLEEAAEAYRDALSVREDRHFSSVDRGLAGFKARQNLAVVLSDLGRLEESARQWRLVADEMPDYRPGWRGLGEVLIRLDPARADALADEMGRRPSLRTEAALMRSRAAFARGAAAEALRWSEAASTEGPDDLEAMRWACQLRFQAGAAAEAEEAIRRLLGRTPDDASAWHNLGTLKLQLGSHEEAEGCYRESLRLRPDHASTHLHLGYALKGGGRPSEAAAAWLDALRLAPDDPAALEELGRLER
jgi:tetratricopeptide (TPR) repeat protein